MSKLTGLLLELLQSVGNQKTKNELSPRTTLKEDLGFDSILIVQLAIKLSKSYNIDLEDCEIELWVTVEDVSNNLKKLNCI